MAKKTNSERDYNITLDLLNGIELTELSTQHNISKTRIIQIFKQQLRKAYLTAYTKQILNDERKLYLNIKAEEFYAHKWVTHSETLKRLLEVIK